MNQIFVPIERVHLETVFEKGGRVEYALLQPAGGVTPLRMRFADLRRQLEERFSPELSSETILQRIGLMKDEQLLVVIHLDREGSRRTELSIRRRYAFEQRPVNVSEQRREKRVRPEQPTDVRVDLGDGSIEGTVYNISEHGLGIALHTSQLERLGAFKLDETTVEIASGDQRVKGRLRSQYPTDGGCVLGVELEQRLRLPGLPDIEA
jgi:hypothetical protein